MKITVLLTGSLLLLASCFDHCNKYEVRNNEVIFKSCALYGAESYDNVVNGADAKTFSIIQTGDDLILAKDRNHIYTGALKLSSVTPNSFKYLGNSFCSDKNSIFYFNNTIHDVVSIPRADRKSFVVDLIAPWATDNSRAYWKSESVKIDDLSNFKIISRTWAKDNSNYYYCGGIVDSIDYGSFKIINEFEAKDKNRSYKYGQIKG